MKDHPSPWIDSGLTCRDITNRATDYLEDRLSTFTKERVGFHLESCAGCRAYVAQLSLVRDTLKLLPKQVPSPIDRFRLLRHFGAFHSH